MHWHVFIADFIGKGKRTAVRSTADHVCFKREIFENARLSIPNPKYNLGTGVGAPVLEVDLPSDSGPTLGRLGTIWAVSRRHAERDDVRR